MKFYNPFKAHIVQTEEGFFIRKFNLVKLQCEYLDRGGYYWCFDAGRWSCSFKDINAARHALLQLKLKVTKSKEKYIES